MRQQSGTHRTRLLVAALGLAAWVTLITLAELDVVSWDLARRAGTGVTVAFLIVVIILEFRPKK